MIAVAHRLSTLRGFDRIVVPQHGLALQDGSPDELLGNDGPYHALINEEVGRLVRHAA